MVIAHIHYVVKGSGHGGKGLEELFYRTSVRIRLPSLPHLTFNSQETWA